MKKIVSTSLFAALATSALAQTGATNVRESSPLDAVVVTATRLDQDILSTPYTAHVIDRERFLDQRAARTLPDALLETPGVMVQRSGYGQASPFIRGFTGFRTLTLIDGIRLNNAVYREGPNQYSATLDLFTVDHLEVVKGPSSVLYGSDAIGGTINALTLSPEMIPWPEIHDGKSAKGVMEKGGPMQAADGFIAHGGARYRYATAEDSHTVRGEFALGITPHFGIIGGVTWKDFDDLRGGDLIGLQEQSGYTDIDGDIKLLFRPNQDVDITAAFQRVEQNNVPRWHSTDFSKSFDGTALGTDLRRELDQLRELAYLQTEIRDPAPWLDKVKFSLSFHRQGEEQDRIRDNGKREITGFQDDQYGVLLGMQSTTKVGTLSYGVEYYHDEVQSWGGAFRADGSFDRVLPRGPVADDSSYDLLGIYVQDQFKITEKFEITAGLRYSWAQVDATKIDPDPRDAVNYPDINESFDAFTASLRFRYDLMPSWNLFGGVSQGFRAPNLSDFTTFDLARSGEREVPATDLDSEKYVSFEIGSKARIDELKLAVYTAYYYTLIDNQIIGYRTGRVINGNEPEVSRTNAGDGHIHGVEFGAEWQFYKTLTLFGNFNWQEGEVDTFVNGDITARPASRIAPLSGLIGLRWQSPGGRFWLEGTAQLARHQDRLSVGDTADTQRIPPGGTRGYSVYSLRGGWNMCENAKLTVALENVSDEDYRIHGSGINEPGTNFVISTHIRF